MWLSWIIPLYNCEEYISICLDSLLHQGLRAEEYEVIVVDDGSTDGGARVVEDYCRRHANIRLIRKENGGVASARNRGIDEARGTYIHFVDADDYLLPDGMKTLRDNYLSVGGDADIIFFWAHTVDKHYKEAEWGHIRPHELRFKGTLEAHAAQFGFDQAVWNKLIKREFLLTSEARFRPYAYGEDMLFMQEIYEQPDVKVLSTNLDIYRYWLRENSACTRVNAEHLRKVIYGNFELCRLLLQYKAKGKYKAEMYDLKIQHLRRVAFVRLVSAPFAVQEIKEIFAKGKEIGFFPVPKAQTKLEKLMNFWSMGQIA